MLGRICRKISTHPTDFVIFRDYSGMFWHFFFNFSFVQFLEGVSEPSTYYVQSEAQIRTIFVSFVQLMLLNTETGITEGKYPLIKSSLHMSVLIVACLCMCQKDFEKIPLRNFFLVLRNFVRPQKDIQKKARAKTKQRCIQNTFNYKINAGWNESTTKSLNGCMMIAISFMNRVLTVGAARLENWKHPNDLFLLLLWQTSQSRVSLFCGRAIHNVFRSRHIYSASASSVHVLDLWASAAHCALFIVINVKWGSCW